MGAQFLMRLKKNKVLAVILLTYFLLIVFLAYKVQIWEDEFYTMDTSSGSITRALDHALNFESQPPFYFVLITIWRKIFTSLFFTRLFSAISILVSIYFVNRIANLLSLKNAFNITLLYAFNPVSIWAGFEARSYALCIMLTTLILYLFIKEYIIDKQKIENRILIAVFALFAISTHYLMVIFLASLGFYLLIIKDFRKLWLFVIDNSIAALLFLLFATLIYKQLSAHEEMHAHSDFSVFQVFSYAFSIIKQFLIGNMGNTFAALRYSIYGLLSLIFVYCWFQNKGVFNKMGKEFWFFTITALFILFILLTIKFVIHMSGVYHRYFVILFVPLLFSFGIFILKLVSNKIVLVIFIVTLFSAYCFSVLNDYQYFSKRFDYKKLNETLTKKEGENTPVYIYRNTQYQIFKEFYSGHNKLIPLPKSLNTNLPFQPKYQWELSTRYIDSLYANQTSKLISFWLITEVTDAAGYAEYLQKFEKRVAPAYKRISEDRINTHLILSGYKLQ